MFDSSIKFKHIIKLSFIVLIKDNNIYVSLINASIYLNLIENFDILHQTNYT